MTRLLIICWCLLIPLATAAQPIPASEWDSSARLWLTRALVGEAGWFPRYSRDHKGRVQKCSGGQCFVNRDWRIIPHVLRKRWARMRSSCTKRDYACHSSGRPFRFEEVVRNYCSPLKSHLADRRFERKHRRNRAKIRAMRRRRFIQSISWSGDNLDALKTAYERHLPWSVRPGLYQAGWAAARAVVTAWGLGKVPNPCPSAEHWDNVPRVGDRLRIVDCGETLNFYSAVRTKG